MPTKKIEFEGKVHEFPDDFTDQEISSALTAEHGSGLDAIRASQAAKYPTAAEQGKSPAGSVTLPQDEQPIPYKVGPFSGTVNPPLAVRGLLGAASAFTGALPGGSTPQKIQQPQLSPEEQFGSDVATTMTGVKAAGGLISAGVGAAKNIIPSAERAGAKFSQVAGAAKDVPIETGPAEDILSRAKELRQRGSTMPKVMSDFERRTAPVTTSPNRPTVSEMSTHGQYPGYTGQPTGPNISTPAEPMTYSEGRDFATNAGRMSAQERLATDPQMQGQVSQFAQALKTANRKAAESVGMEHLYDQAIKEYHQAKSMQEAGDIIKKWSVRALLGAGAVRAGYEAYKALP